MSRNILYEETPLLQIRGCLAVTREAPLGAMTGVSGEEEFPTSGDLDRSWSTISLYVRCEKPVSSLRAFASDVSPSKRDPNLSGP